MTYTIDIEGREYPCRAKTLAGAKKACEKIAVVKCAHMRVLNADGTVAAWRRGETMQWRTVRHD